MNAPIQQPALRATHLRAVHTLGSADILQLGNDPQLFRVIAVERTSADPGARCKILLRGVYDASSVTLVRAAREMVLAVERSAPRA